MQATIAVVTVAVLVLVAWLARRRRQRQRQALGESTARFLESLVSNRILVEQDDHSLTTTSPGGTCVAIRLATLHDLVQTYGEKETCQVLAERLSSGLAPAEAFDIKIHGTAVLPLIVPSLLVEMLEPQREAVARALPGGQLSALYVLAEENGDLRYLTDAHLHEMSIDRRDLYGIGYAVLRQRLPFTALKARLEKGPVRVAPEDRFAASHLLTVDELLGDHQRLFALAQSSKDLWLAAEQMTLNELEPASQVHAAKGPTAAARAVYFPPSRFIIHRRGLDADTTPVAE